MRILLVADVVGGVRTFVRELVRHAAAADLELHLALLGREPVPLPGAASCEVRDLALEWMEDPWDDVAATATWIEELRARYAPDVIHMNTFAPVLHCGVPVLLTVHSCVLSWWRAVHGHDAPAERDRYAQLVRHALHRADVLTVPTRALLDELEAVYGEISHARVIPNGRSVDGARVDAREDLVVSVGRLWDEAKNAALVARAAPAIRGRVVLIGSGEIAGVDTLGWLPEDEVLAWLRRGAVFAEPARYEPFGLAALEAALCGCALVLGDIPSLREVWGQAASYVSSDDPAQLAAAVNGLLEDPGRRARAAAAAQARARRYPPAAMAAAYRRAYHDTARAPVIA